MVSEMIPVGSPSAMKRSTTPCGGRGTAISLMFSAAMRPVSRFFSCDVHCESPDGAASPRSGILHPSVRAKKAGQKAWAMNGHRRSALRLGACPGGRRSIPLPPFRRTKANPMIDFYTLTSPNVQKVYIMLEECGLPYKEHFVDVWKGEQYSPEFSKINPNNKIPVDRRSRRTGRQALHGDRVGRDPALSRREDRQVPAQGHGEEIRRDAVADDPAHRRRADVRAMDALQAVRAEDRQ